MFELVNGVLGQAGHACSSREARSLAPISRKCRLRLVAAVTWAAWAIVAALAITPPQLAAETITYEHYDDGRLRRAIYPDGRVVTYSYDANGNRTGSTITQPPDTTAPSAPGTPTISAITGTSASASWTAATDNVAVTGYDYRLNGGGWQPIGNVLSINLTGLSAATSYTFQVRAVDAESNIGPVSSASFATPDTVAPSQPTGLSASAPNSATVNLTWTASTDNVGVTGYRVLRNGGQIATTGTNSYTDSTVSGTTNYAYSVIAYDAAGNNSPVSSTVNVTTPDSYAPSVPSGLSATAVSATQVNLAWNGSSDTGGSGLAGYHLYRNGSHIATTGSTSYSDTAVSGSTSYSYTVAAYDNAGNVSGQSNAANVTTPQATPGTPGLSLQPGTSLSRFTANWTVPSGPVSYYQLEVSINWGTPTVETLYPPATSKAFQGGDADWQLRIRACNSSDACSVWSGAQSYHTCPNFGCP